MRREFIDAKGENENLDQFMLDIPKLCSLLALIGLFQEMQLKNI